jgi:hypothetical protein
MKYFIAGVFVETSPLPKASFALPDPERAIPSPCQILQELQLQIPSKFRVLNFTKIYKNSFHDRF